MIPIFTYFFVIFRTAFYIIDTTSSTTSANIKGNYTCNETKDEILNVSWSATHEGECVVSKPLCLDKNKEVQKRCCKHAGWNTRPECVTIQNPSLTPCPQNFHYYPDEDLCYFITDEMQFPPKCPSKNVVSFNATRMGIMYKDEPIWVPVRRDYFNGIGFLRWTEYSARFKNVFLGDIDYSGNSAISDMNCVVYFEGKYRGASCNGSYKAVCAYSRLVSGREWNYCERKLGICKHKDYSDDNKCFCTQYGRFVEYAKIRPPLAELLYSYQNELVANLIHDKCLIGLKRVNLHEYIWINSQSNINYTFWSRDVDYNPNNTVGVFTALGWALNPNESDVDCFVYEDAIISENPVLKLSQNSMELELQIKNENDLMKFTEGERSIKVFCFTDTTNSSEILYRFDYFNETGEYKRFLKWRGHFWCEAVNNANFEIVKSGKLLFKPASYGCEFVAIVKILHKAIMQQDIKDAVRNTQRNISNIVPNYYVRAFEILEIDTFLSTITLNVHLTEEQPNFHTNCVEKLFILKTNLTKNNKFKLVDISSADFCIGEQSNNVTWPVTMIGRGAYSNKLCMTSEKRLFKRHCSGSFKDGAQWENMQETCIIVNTSSSVTEDLSDLLKLDLAPEKIISGLHNITNSYKNFSTLDIYIISEILGLVTDLPETYLQYLLETVSSLNDLDRATFATAQSDFNATDKILKNVDIIFSNISSNMTYIQSKNNLLLSCNIASIRIEGLLLFKNKKGYELQILEDNKQLREYMKNSSLEAAVVIPRSLQQQIISNASNSNARVVFAVYLLDTLFNSPGNVCKQKHSVSQIFDILIPGLKQPFWQPLQIYYRATSEETIDSCVYWYFGQTQSFWKEESEPSPVSAYKRCDFPHITHFALLLFDDPSIEPPSYQHTLDIITYINCTLSLLGLTMILLTAILFASWRLNAENKLLMNFAFVLALQIILLYISVPIHKTRKLNNLCTIVGVVLQYSIISEFCWMLIVVLIQFKRYVPVFWNFPEYLVLRSSIIGWIIPFFSVFSVLVFDQKTYVRDQVGLCYPSGLSLYLSIWLPVGVIVAINIALLSRTLYNLHVKNVYSKMDCEEKYQWRMLFFLFFMFGLTWTFGFLLHFHLSVIFVYLFTFLASIQGFIMFILFIVMNKKTCLLYSQYYAYLYAAWKLKQTLRRGDSNK